MLRKLVLYICYDNINGLNRFYFINIELSGKILLDSWINNRVFFDEILVNNSLIREL